MRTCKNHPTPKKKKKEKIPENMEGDLGSRFPAVYLQGGEREKNLSFLFRVVITHGRVPAPPEENCPILIPYSLQVELKKNVFTKQRREFPILFW
jgi:hypothetical protein